MSSNVENTPNISQEEKETVSETYSDPTKFSWSSEVDLVMNCIGYSVGLGNIWRFPYMAFKNGGGAFLIPYLILTLTINYPLYYMELLIGQITHLDLVSVWSFCPVFKGLGISLLLRLAIILTYYNVIIAYAVFYIFQTFREVLPWSECFEWWGATEDCYKAEEGVSVCKRYSDSSSSDANCTNGTESSTDQFWKIYVLDLSSGMDDPGTIKWDLALALLATWAVIALLTLIRHHSTFEKKIKTIYFTALFPFFVLAIFFCYALSLPGAPGGLKRLFVPKWSSLLDATVWSDAVITNLYSLGIAQGALIVFGRKNSLNFRTSRCAFISSIVDTFAGILASTVTFMVVGFLSEISMLEFSKTTLSGYGLVFVTYADAMLHIPVPHLWAFLFFAMVVTLAIDVSVANIECLALGLQVLFFHKKTETILPVGIVTIVLFLAGLSCVTNGGAFVLNLLDYFGGGLALMGVAMFHAIAFGWGYGVNFKDFKTTEDSEPHLSMRLYWIVIPPITLTVLFIFSLVEAKLLPLYDIPYPDFANDIGWIIVAVVLFPVPLGMMISLWQNRKDTSRAFKPDEVWKKAVYQMQQLEKNV